MLVSEDMVVSLERIGNVEPQEAELEAARSSLATGTVVRAGVYPDHSITSSARASNVPRHFEAGCVRILVRCGWSRYFFAVIIL
jgi:hypothetical protein